MEVIMIFDTHAHYDDEKFDSDRDILLEDIHSHNISPIVNVSSSLESIKRTLQLADQYPYIYAAIGIHPSDSGDLSISDFSYIESLLLQEKVIAVGEIGLDYYWKEPDSSIQKKWFTEQIHIAKRARLPMIIHSRDAAKDTIDIMRDEHCEEIGGVIHCYSYSKELARDFLNMGFFFGIGGVVTFSNSKKLKEVVSFLPLSQIVLETDCPYLAPVPNRGKRNSSLNLTYVIEEIASIKGCSIQEVEDITFQNAVKLYRLESKL